MNLRFFIDRPVFSGVISVVIVLLGMISMFSLPVEQYPDIAPPTINYSQLIREQTLKPCRRQ